MVASVLMRIVAHGLERRERLDRDLHRRSSVRATGSEKEQGEMEPWSMKRRRNASVIGSKEGGGIMRDKRKREKKERKESSLDLVCSFRLSWRCN